jgi:hypothetical protein
MQPYKAYAGIGSRETPSDVLLLMRDVAQHLGLHGFTLRSGAADGADRAFEEGALDADTRGANRRPEVYLPWPSFNKGNRAMLSDRYYVGEPQAEALPIAAVFHPAWDRLSQGAQKLHARNVHQILGADVTRPVLSKFVVCWTRMGAGGGGTGQALRIAEHFKVPAFDLANWADRERIESWVYR